MKKNENTNNNQQFKKIYLQYTDDFIHSKYKKLSKQINRNINDLLINGNNYCKMFMYIIDNCC